MDQKEGAVSDPTDRPLHVYHVGVVTYLELVKKAKKTPAFAGFLKPETFAMSFGWYQTKNKRGYTDEEADQFLKGFADAKALKERDEAGS